jgi:hypothetical protein
MEVIEHKGVATKLREKGLTLSRDGAGQGREREDDGGIGAKPKAKEASPNWVSED